MGPRAPEWREMTWQALKTGAIRGRAGGTVMIERTQQSGIPCSGNEV